MISAEGEARLGPLRFRVVDTAGLEEATDESLAGRMRKLTERAVGMADACLFVIDARAGVLPADRVFAEILRRSGKTVLVAANKAEGRAAEAGLIEAWELGLGQPIGLSAEHGEGMSDLLSVLMPLVDAADEAGPVAFEEAPDIGVDVGDDDEEGAYVPDLSRPLQVAVVGRPNAGKSTLVNALLGDERLLTGPEAGITRDAISLDLDWDGRPVRIFDTAGMRKTREGAGKAREDVGLRRAEGGEVRRGPSSSCSMRPSPSNRRICASPTSPSGRVARWSSRSTNGISRRTGAPSSPS